MTTVLQVYFELPYDETTDCPQVSLEMLFYSEWDSLKILGKLGSYSHLPCQVHC